MSLVVCEDCTARFSPTLEQCPQCRGTDRIEAWKVDNVELSQQDYDERKARQDDGRADDEDRRLIKLYEKQGYTQSPRGTDGPDGAGSDVDSQAGADGPAAPGGGLGGEFTGHPQVGEGFTGTEVGGPDGPVPGEPESVGSVDDVTPVDGDSEQDEPLTPPSRSAPKDDWVAYARQVNQRDAGLAEENPDPGKLTKDDLVQRYGR